MRRWCLSPSKLASSHAAIDAIAVSTLRIRPPSAKILALLCCFAKAAISGESMFQNVYTARANGMVAFGSSFPGTIKELRIAPGADIIVQKKAFLASEMGVELSVFFNQKIGGGLFGGEGFIMQRLAGAGTAFIEVDGGFVEYQLAPRQQLIVDTGNVLGFTGGVNLEIQRVKGAKNIVFGGEGLFNTVLTGPGIVWLQTMPLVSLAASIAPYIPTGNS